MIQPGKRFQKEKVKTAKGRKTTSTRWIQRKINDRFTKMAHSSGYRSRAAFKLIEMIEKFPALRKSKNIIDLGAAPGGWSQVLAQLFITEKNAVEKVVALDLKTIEPISGVEFTQGDFTEEAVQQQLGHSFDLVVSDMAPYATGDRETDHLRIASLAEDVLAFCEAALVKHGNCIIKILEGAQCDQICKQLKNVYGKVVKFKPEASHKDSREIYLVLLGKK